LANNELKLDFSDKELSKRKTIIEDMVYDFGVRFESGEINSIEDYFKLLDNNA